MNPLFLSAFIVIACLAGCATSPPKQVGNACRIFEEKPHWYELTRDTQKKWGVPVQVQLAIIRQESSFVHDARPPRDTVLGIPMWWRTSSAYGFAQIKDGTWDWYQDKTGNHWASRDNFDDAVDFIGWYTDISQKKLRISKWDTYNQYLAYHEGHGGWKRKTYKKKAWLIKVARKVDKHARTYGAQLKTCRERLESKTSWLPF